jgi:hypothetical protein
MINMDPIQCEGCGESTAGYDIISYGGMESGYRQLCSRCFNAEVAKLTGLDDFEHFRFDPIGIVDSAGEAHQFHFQVRLLGNVVALDAFELRDGVPSGYQFQMVGEPEDDLLALLGRLIEKIRRRLSVKYLTDGGHELQIAGLNRSRGRGALADVVRAG